MPNVDFESPSTPGAEASSTHEVQLQAEDILEISDAIALPPEPATAEVDDLILFPGPEPVVVPVEHETFATRIDGSQLPEAEPVTSAGGQSFVKPDHGDRPAAQEAPAVDITLPLKESPFNEAVGSKGVRLISFSGSKLLAVAGAFVLFMISAEVLTGTSVKVNVKAENAPATVPLSSPQVAPDPKPLPVQAPASGMSAQAPTVPENKSVEKSVAAPDPAPDRASTADRTATPPDDKETDKGMFTIQVGSHKDPGAANTQAEKLKAAGFEPRVVSAEIPNRGRWYRVQVGKFGSRDEANRMGAQIVSKGAAENFVLSGL